MGFCNRGWQANACIAPIWDEAGNDQVCRQWARDAAEMFKDELKRGTKGGDGAVMLYGNYDREYPDVKVSWLKRLADITDAEYDEKSRDIFGANYPRLQKLKAKY